MTTRTRSILAITVFISSASLLATPALAGALEDARKERAAGVAAFKQAVATEDAEGQKAAAAQLREALRLYNKHLEATPEDLDLLEDELSEVNSLLFWIGRMSVPDFGDDEAEIDPEIARAEELARRERVAAERLEAVLEFARQNPADLYGQRAEYRELVIELPDTQAARSAEMEIARLEAAIRMREAADAASDAELAAEESKENSDRNGDEAEAEAEADDSEDAGDAATTAVLPLYQALEAERSALEGSEVERAMREMIRDLFARRRFVEARERCRSAIDEAGSAADRDRIDRILAGLTRAVTIMDHALATAIDQRGKAIDLQVTSGASFAGTLEKVDFDSLVVVMPQATVHVPAFRLNDATLVRLSTQRGTSDARLAVAAFLSLLGRGKDALPHLKAAQEAGASEEEVSALQILAGDEKSREELAARIKKERARFKHVERAASAFIKEMKKKKYLDALRQLMKGDDKAHFTDRDLLWISSRCTDDLKQPLNTAIFEARETCSRQHLSEARGITCPECQGVGTILTKSPGGYFGVKPRNPVRVTCPTCKGDKTIRCPDCFVRFHDEMVRELARRLPPVATPSAPGEGGKR